MSSYIDFVAVEMPVAGNKYTYCMKAPSYTSMCGMTDRIGSAAAGIPMQSASPEV